MNDPSHKCVFFKCPLWVFLCLISPLCFFESADFQPYLAKQINGQLCTLHFGSVQKYLDSHMCSFLHRDNGFTTKEEVTAVQTNLGGFYCSGIAAISREQPSNPCCKLSLYVHKGVCWWQTLIVILLPLPQSSWIARCPAGFFSLQSGDIESDGATW